MKHTQGKVYIDSRITTTSIKSENGMDICLMVAGVKYLNLANAELIAEAFNVTNECGLTPRQLLEQRNELLNSLNIYVNSVLHTGEIQKWYSMYKNDTEANKVLVKAIEAINNAQNK